MCFSKETLRLVLPCRTSHVQSPLDTADYGGRGLMISAAGLERSGEKDMRLLLGMRKRDCCGWKGLIKRNETTYFYKKKGFQHNEQSK